MKRLSVILFLSLAFNARSQDPHFSQFYNAAMYLNPAFAGSHMAPEVAVNYRNQWSGLTGNFKTYYFSYSQYIKPIRGGLGIYSIYDDAGDGMLTSKLVNLAYAAHIEIKNKVVIQPAVTSGYRWRKLKTDNLTFGDLIDPRYGFVYPTTSTETFNHNNNFFDISSGILIYSREWYAGFSASHLTEPDESFLRPHPGSELPIRFSYNAGYVVTAGDAGKWLINPDILYLRQRDFEEWKYGLTVKYDIFRAGVAIRHNDAIIMAAGFDTGRLILSYSYDVTTSTLAAYTGGSHEVAAAYRFINKVKPPAQMVLNAVAF